MQAQGEYRAGGTDLMDRLRHHVASGDIVDISRIPGMDHITVLPHGSPSIGALVPLHEVATNAGLRSQYPGLVQAAGALANPQIRRVASMGGALLQRNRCWYYRHEDFSCFKKGGTTCPMREGNHQYGVCYDLGPCVSPHPSTLGMALLAYGAEVEVEGRGRRTIAALYGDGSQAAYDHLLEPGELLTHIHLPPPLPGEQAAYFRSISRARAEWPLVEALVRGQTTASGNLGHVHVAIGGVANIPLRLPSVESYLNGRRPGRETYAAAGRIATEGANPLTGTQYKVELVARTIATTLALAFGGLEQDP